MVEPVAGIGPVFALDGVTPKIAPDAFIAPTAAVIGDVVIGSETGIWFHCLVRGDLQFIRIGARTNIQDGTIIHVDSGGYSTIIGDDVTVGHNAVIHACTLKNRAFVGISRHRAGRRGDRGGRHAGGRRPADARQGDRSERAVDRRARASCCA